LKGVAVVARGMGPRRYYRHFCCAALDNACYDKLEAKGTYALFITASLGKFFSMASVKLSVLATLLVADALVAAGIWFGVIPTVTLQEWLLFNAVAAAISLAIFLATRRHRKRGSKSEEHYHQRLLTDRGEVVKSWGEKMIADYFHAHNIKYQYEKPASDSSNRRVISRPDFYLPEYDIYVEYWGMVNTEEPGKRREYVKGMEWKMARYRESGLKVISVYPKDLGHLDSIFRAKLKK